MPVQKRSALTPQQGEAKATTSMKSPSKQGKGWTSVQKHIMTGISNMIPFLIMGGLILAFSQLIPYVVLGVDPSMGIVDAMNTGQFSGFEIELLKFADLTQSFGGTLFGFAIPMFAAFTANSIGGKLAFPAGFIGGLVANKPSVLMGIVDGAWAETTPVASGFLGALLIAFLAGHIVKWLNAKIKVSRNMLAFKSTFLIPVIGALFVMFIMHYAITPLGGMLNEAIKVFLESVGAAGEYGYAFVLSATTAIDLGGPINKAAGFVALGFTTESMLPITARCIAIVVPGIGLGLATILDKWVVKRRVFDKQFYPQGKTTMFLSFMGIGEGSIPFALDCPKIIIPAYMIGSIVGGLLATALGAVQWFPESAIWVWPLVENLPGYIIAIIVGSLVTALIAIFGRNRLISKGKIIVDSNEE